MRVKRVVCAVDCGTMVHPDLVRSQMESGIIYGLSAALKGEITIEQGRVAQSNFGDYPMLTLDECPAIEVHLAPSGDPVGGIGEPGLPPIAPAVANAVFAATGKPVRQAADRARMRTRVKGSTRWTAPRRRGVPASGPRPRAGRDRQP